MGKALIHFEVTANMSDLTVSQEKIIYYCKFVDVNTVLNLACVGCDMHSS